MSTRWRLLGPLETIDGMVMFGISTAQIVALITRLIDRRLKAKEAASSPDAEERFRGGASSQLGAEHDH
jgi:hypothetical protein